VLSAMVLSDIVKYVLSFLTITVLGAVSATDEATGANRTPGEERSHVFRRSRQGILRDELKRPALDPHAGETAKGQIS